MNRCRKITALTAGAVLLGLSGAALAQTGSGTTDNSMSSGMNNYSILNNQFYNYMDLQHAMNSGLSDTEVATIAKIARKSGMSFEAITRAVQRGETFPYLAMHYNLRMSDVDDVDQQKQDITNYMTLYRSIGSMSGGMSGSGMSGMSGGTMGTSTTGTGTP